MIPKDSLSGNSAFLLTLLLLVTVVHTCQAQKRPPNPLESFLDTQFWLGLKMGINYTQAHPEKRNTGFSPVNYDADSLKKNYNDFADPGAHMGLEMTFYHRGFSISFQPSFKRANFSYSSQLSWQNENGSTLLETTYNVDQHLDLIELPLMIKYDVLQSGKIRPFVMVGGFHSVIISAQKDVSITQTDFSGGTPLNSPGGSTSLAVKDAFQNFRGVSGGVGANLDYWNIRTVVEISYRHSLTEVTRPNFQQNELASLGEINDDITLRDLNFSVSFIFPFRFIDQQFKAL